MCAVTDLLWTKHSVCAVSLDLQDMFRTPCFTLCILGIPADLTIRESLFSGERVETFRSGPTEHRLREPGALQWRRSLRGGLVGLEPVSQHGEESRVGALVGLELRIMGLERITI